MTSNGQTAQRLSRRLAAPHALTEAKVDTGHPGRGPLLIMSGERDHTVPWAIADASFKKQQGNEGVTEIVTMPNRGHALTIDSGWREVADTALAFVQRFVK
jgi:pimeloyl-ACP methyl ester carboxylesterase